MTLPRKPTPSYEAIPEPYLGVFRHALLQILVRKNDDLEQGKCFVPFEALKEVARVTAKHHKPSIPATTLIHTYKGLSRLTTNYYRDALLFVAPRAFFCGSNDKTVWLSEDAHAEYIAGRPKTLGNKGYGANSVYDKAFKIQLHGALEDL